MATARTTTNVSTSLATGGHVNDEHAKASSASVFPVKHPGGHVISVWSDGAVYDETSAKFVNIDTLVRNG
jgi:hypothetical protein